MYFIAQTANYIHCCLVWKNKINA